MSTTKRARAKKPEVTEKIEKELVQKKGPIHYEVELNEEQKEAKRLIYNNQITVLTGRPGSGKTLAAVITALDMYFKKEIKKIFITRPNVKMGEDYGFLPGDLKEKMDPLLIPIYDNLYRVYRDEKTIKNLIEKSIIDIAPIAYIRGRTIDDALLIIDEAQNIDDETAEALLTRIGKYGKIVICGDWRQIDFKDKSLSSIRFLAELATKEENMAYLDLKVNHRSPLVDIIVDAFEKRREEIKIERENRKLIKG